MASRSVVVMRGNNSPLVVLLISMAATAEGADVLPNMVPPTKLLTVVASVWYMPFVFVPPAAISIARKSATAVTVWFRYMPRVMPLAPPVWFNVPPKTILLWIAVPEAGEKLSIKLK